ncbi:hypothetical protein SAY86_024999 [Trapa natans]|uniref:Uncharacterized protein n=1 Tax=Trapa natans TaxID=22666 RepID=A0AAN7M7K6_TRANT|nr:hypothetical protein SAY86_024999 [Trapa natans]
MKTELIKDRIVYQNTTTKCAHYSLKNRGTLKLQYPTSPFYYDRKKQQQNLKEGGGDSKGKKIIIFHRKNGFIRDNQPKLQFNLIHPFFYTLSYIFYQKETKTKPYHLKYPTNLLLFCPCEIYGVNVP